MLSKNKQLQDLARTGVVKFDSNPFSVEFAVNCIGRVDIGISLASMRENNYLKAYQYLFKGNTDYLDVAVGEWVSQIRSDAGFSINDYMNERLTDEICYDLKQSLFMVLHHEEKAGAEKSLMHYIVKHYLRVEADKDAAKEGRIHHDTNY